MALHAFQDLEDALSATREFLTPVDLRQWLKLALVVFFVGGGTNFPTSGINWSNPSPSGRVPPPDVTPELTRTLLLVVAVVVVLGVLAWLAFAVVSAVMEFVFVEALRSGDVTVRRYWHRRWRQGLRLFVFRLAVALPVLLLVVGVAGIVLLSVLAVGAAPVVPFAAILVALPVLFVLGVVTGLVNGFTTAFVVPIMILEDCGVLAGWRRLWPTVLAEWKQYLAYVGVSFVLSVLAGGAASILMALVAVVLLVPLGAVGLLVVTVLSLSSPVSVVTLAVLAVVFVAVVVVLWALLQVPIQTYLRYFALLVLGDIEASFDVVPEQRAAIRE